MAQKKFICQWSLEIVYGKQKQAIEIMKKWNEEKFRTSNFKKSELRMMKGFIGVSASVVIDEYAFETLEDLEKALADMAQPQFKKYSDELAPLVVSGSQKWTILVLQD